MINSDRGPGTLTSHGASAMKATNVSAAFRLLVAEVMHAADTVASQPPAFEHKLKVNMERSRRAQGGCGGCFAG